MFAIFGDVLFEVLSSPRTFNVRTKYRYAQHKVVEAAPRLQWLARELAKISLELGFHVAFTSPAAQMNLLRAAAEDHQARALVFGNGVHRGYFVIESIEETQHQLADDGSYVAITARLELREWIPGADFDPLAPPRRRTKPPGIVARSSSDMRTSQTPLLGSAGAAPSAFDPTQPIGPHNLLPTSAIVQLTNAGAGPGVTYSPATYSQPGVSAVVGKGGSQQSAVQQPGDVPASQIVRH
jgi:phage protein U